MILSVAVADAKKANEACVKLYGPAAIHTFDIPLVDPASKATMRYWCGWETLTEDGYKKLIAECPKITRHEGKPEEVLESLGLVTKPAVGWEK